MKIHKRLIKLLGIPILLLFAVSCEREVKQTLPERNWTMVWSDEFDGAKGSLPDASKWNFDIGNGASGWGNQELQYYTNRPENIALDGAGNLVITAKSETYEGFPYTSARINTKGKFSQTYGKIEARIKTPYGPGLWPAFWMLGEDMNGQGWPFSGEIDIMELRGQKPSIVNSTLHGPGYSGGGSLTKAYGLQNGRFDTDFHVFAVEWFPERIDFFVDGYLFYRLTPAETKVNWVFNHPFYILLNLAVGGNYVGYPNSQTVFPQQMTVDYVRVYK